MTRPDADCQSLDDISESLEALEQAQASLSKAMAGEEIERLRFIFNLGFARGRIERVCQRLREETDA